MRERKFRPSNVATCFDTMSFSNRTIHMQYHAESLLFSELIPQQSGNSPLFFFAQCAANIPFACRTGNGFYMDRNSDACMTKTSPHEHNYSGTPTRHAHADGCACLRYIMHSRLAVRSFRRWPSTPYCTWA